MMKKTKILLILTLIVIQLNSFANLYFDINNCEESHVFSID